jgi:SAM-dependent methyltransferase
MVWDKTYQLEKKIWGEEPGELALFTTNYIKNSPNFQNELNILDVGCGYGQNAIYLANNLNCYILGVDNSGGAITLARELCPKNLEKRVEFLCYNFKDLIDKYDVIFASNLYQILEPEERGRFKETIKRCLKCNGLLFLNTLSVRDPHHNGNGIPVPGDPNSFRNEKYIHLCTRNELENDFGFLHIPALFEREFSENHSNGNKHRHISWVMMGRMQ